MEQQMTEFEGLLSEGDARREAFDSASAELAKYKKTVESLLVTSAENKTQAYVSATSNLPMFNEHIESYMNQMLEITGGADGTGTGTDGAECGQSAHDRGGGKSGTACSSRGDHAGIADLGHRSGEICYEAGG